MLSRAPNPLSAASAKAASLRLGALPPSITAISQILGVGWGEHCHYQFGNSVGPNPT